MPSWRATASPRSTAAANASGASEWIHSTSGKRAATSVYAARGAPFATTMTWRGSSTRSRAPWSAASVPASINGASRSGTTTEMPGRQGPNAGGGRAGANAARRSAAAAAMYSGARRSRCRQLVPHMDI